VDRLAMDAAEAAVDAGYPSDGRGLLIVELEAPSEVVEVEFSRLMQVIEESQAYEVWVAKDEAERAMISKGRKRAFSAVGRLSPDYIVQDGVVPRTKLGQALAEIERLSRQYDLPIANVSHAVDGNFHPLILFRRAQGRGTGTSGGARRRAPPHVHPLGRLYNGGARRGHGEARLPARDVRRERHAGDVSPAQSRGPGRAGQPRQDARRGPGRGVDGRCVSGRNGQVDHARPRAVRRRPPGVTP